VGGFATKFLHQILDIVQGCRFLHAADPPVVHGDLKSMVSRG